jgi:hypothetical protein
VLRLARHLRQHSGTVSQDLAFRVEMLVYARLPGWAARSGQSADGLRLALGKLTAVIDAMPSIAEAPARDDRARYESIRGALADVANARPIGLPITMPELLARWLPWERRRMGRVLDYAASADYERIRALEHQLSTGGGAARFQMVNPREIEICQSTLGTRNLYVNGENLARSLVDMATFRRATRLTLRLMAWRLEHGSLPDSLAELDQADADIRDPYSDQAFRYEPGGLRLARLQIPGLRSPLTGRVADGRPIVWSVGSKLLRIQDERDRMGYQVVEAGVSQLISVQDAWHFGWAFPIPDQAPAASE